jgi:chromosome segregation ATPase
MTDQLTDALREIERLRNENAERAADRDQARAQCEDLTSRIHQLSGAQEQSQAERDRLSDELAKVMAEVGSLRAALYDRDQAIRHAVDAHRAEIDGLHQALELSKQTHRDELARLGERQQLSQKQTQSVADLEAECERLRAEVERLRQAEKNENLQWRLDEAERLNRELSHALSGMGISFHPLFAAKEAEK